MEYPLNKTTVYAVKSILDTVCEQPVDAEVTLPDYCPDIERILRCSLTEWIDSESVSGGELSAQGSARISVLYIDADKHHIRSFEHQTPWSAAIEISAEITPATDITTPIPAIKREKSIVNKSTTASTASAALSIAKRE